MKEESIELREGLAQGLRPTDKSIRNNQMLTQAEGMVPDSGSLRSLDVISLLSGITALGEVFPYPQLFVGQSHTLVFGQTKLWELVGGTLVLKLSGLTAGTLWTVADFFHFMIATNGKQVLKRDPISDVWSVLSDPNVPVGYCVAAVNGQLLVGSPGACGSMRSDFKNTLGEGSLSAQGASSGSLGS